MSGCRNLFSETFQRGTKEDCSEIRSFGLRGRSGTAGNGKIAYHRQSDLPLIGKREADFGHRQDGTCSESTSKFTALGISSIIPQYPRQRSGSLGCVGGKYNDFD